MTFMDKQVLFSLVCVRAFVGGFPTSYSNAAAASPRSAIFARQYQGSMSLQIFCQTK